MMAEWVRALAWAGDRTGSNPTSEKVSLRNFGNSIYRALPSVFILSEETLKLKSRRSLLLYDLQSGVTRGSKVLHQSALECVTVVDSTTLREGQL